MTITREEFLRLLPAAIGDIDPKLVEDFVTGTWNGIEWDLRILEHPERRVASLSLPVLEVMLTFKTDDAAAVAPFLERFNRAFQRAGG